MKLKEIIANKLEQAHRNRGQHQSADLGNGLHLRLYILDSNIHFLIWRHQVRPADHEWNTIMRHWPWPLPDPLPAPDYIQSASGAECGLRSRWPIKPTL